MDSQVDERSDLYSLGVVLYRVFSGVLPFQAADPLEWVHAHLARTPAPLAALRPELPQVVSDIVMKLLSKAPEERYQSARGLEADLAHCLASLTREAKNDSFPLAEHDFADHFETSQAHPQRLDLVAVIKASQAVSQKIVLGDLLEMLMRVVLQSAGAQTASLLQLRGRELVVAAVAKMEPGGVEVHRGDEQPPSASSMPLSILDFVRRSNEHVLLNEETVPNPFADDPYFAQRRPKSILCLPIVRQAEVSALLYVENDQISHAFTPDRLGILELLASQAAISLENAELYADLRRECAERRQAEAALTKSKALLQTIIDSAPAAICVKDREGRYLLVNEYFARAMRTDRAGLLGKLDTDLFTPEEAAVIHGADLRVLETRSPIELEEVIRLHDGVHTFLANKAPLTDLSGEIFGVCGVETDITGRKQAEAALRQTEEQLRQAQKMEAVGNLAGGIAHDFNNLLSIILSYSTVLARDLEPDDPKRADLQEIEAAGLRAAELTRRLLAFGRKQVLQPVIVNVNDTLRGMERMLRRLIGEDIELTLTTDPALGRTRIDPGQLEQIIMNLSLNSRDAMPRGGKLTLRTSNVELDPVDHPGRAVGPHVMLEVTDTGIGMDQAIKARIFEPFFTTKAAGKGTGLGLSTVFGIVQQSGGSIWVDSEPGKGTCVRLYFPRVQARVSATAAPAAKRLVMGTETVLLVEDDESVRKLARTILQRSGYRVLEAEHGAAAIQIFEANPGIQLLVSDVVMPGMSGPELAERLRPLRPEMRVLFMSGYTGDAISHHGVLDPGLAFLQKPFTPESLTRKVREVLDAPGR
jgi:PAS domain S-box-containing protein